MPANLENSAVATLLPQLGKELHFPEPPLQIQCLLMHAHLSCDPCDFWRCTSLVWDHAQKQTQLTHRAASSFAVSSGFFGGQWHEIHPQYWTKYQVWEWLQHLLDTNQLDASCIPFQEFDVNGEHLCSMSLQEFTRAAGTAGQLLYSNLQHLKWNGDSLSLSLPCWEPAGRAETPRLAGFLFRDI